MYKLSTSPKRFEPLSFQVCKMEVMIAISLFLWRSHAMKYIRTVLTRCQAPSEHSVREGMYPVVAQRGSPEARLSASKHSTIICKALHLSAALSSTLAWKIPIILCVCVPYLWNGDMNTHLQSWGEYRMWGQVQGLNQSDLVRLWVILSHSIKRVHYQIVSLKCHPVYSNVD